MRNTTTTRIMAAVALIYATRLVLSKTALKCYALVVLVWGVGRLVWVSKVVENFFAVEKNGLQAMGDFALTAISHAHVGVQLILLASIMVVGSLFLDLSRAAAPRGARLAA